MCNATACKLGLRVQQVLLQERKDGCWWFNKAGRCGVNTAKIVLLVICAIADLLVSTYMIVLGSEDLSAKSKWCAYSEVPWCVCRSWAVPDWL